MADVIETDYTTDPPTVTERDFTPEESAQREADRVAAELAAIEAATAEAARVKAVQDAQAEAKALGFSDGAVATITGYPYPYDPTAV